MVFRLLMTGNQVNKWLPHLSSHLVNIQLRMEITMKKTHTIPQQLQNHNSTSYPGNLPVQNTITCPQSITNNTPAQLSNHLISKRNHNDENLK